MSIEDLSEHLDIDDRLARWPTAKLRDLCLRGTLVDPAREPAKEFEYVDVSSVSSESLRITGTTTVKGATAPSRARKLLRHSDVIFATVRPTLRRVALVPQDLDGQLASTAFCVIRANPDIVDPRFLYYASITDEFIQRVGVFQRGASYPAVTDGNVMDQEVLVPPLPEQRAIAGVLSKLQTTVELQDRIVATLKELKAATMAKLFCEGHRGEPLKQTEIGEIPESWDVVPLGAPSFSRMLSGGTPSRSISSYYGGSIPWVKSGELKDGGVETTEETITEEALGRSSARLLPSGTLLIAMYGATAGMTAILKIEAATNQAVCAIQPVADSFNPDFLQGYLIHARPRLLAERHGGAQPNISQTILRSLAVPVAPRPEQEIIGGVLAHINGQTEVAIKRLDLLQRLFCSTLDALVTGRVRVPKGIRSR